MEGKERGWYVLGAKYDELHGQKVISRPPIGDVLYVCFVVHDTCAVTERQFHYRGGGGWKTF